jgi:hypothetical protein
MNLDLRPLTVSEFLDRTFSIYRHRFLLFVALMSPQAVLSLAATLLWATVTSPARLEQGLDPERLSTFLIGAAIGIVVFVLIHWVFYVIGLGATAAAVSDLHGRMTPDAGSSFAAARRRVGSLLWVTLLMSLRLGGVALACFVLPIALLVAGGDPFRPGATPGPMAIIGLVLLLIAMVVAVVLVIWMGMRYAVAIPAVMLEAIGGGAGLARSVTLTKGLLLRVFLLMICSTMVTYASAMILQMPFVVAMLVAGADTTTGFWMNMIGTATGTAGQTLTAPIAAIGVCVLYFEARVRHEALDLQVMTDALAPAGPATVPPGMTTAPPPLPH